MNILGYNQETEFYKIYFLECVWYYLPYSELPVRESTVEIFEKMDFQEKSRYCIIEKIIKKITYNKQTKRYSRKQIASKVLQNKKSS